MMPLISPWGSAFGTGQILLHSVPTHGIILNASCVTGNKPMSKAIHFWERSVGVEITPHAAADGTYCWRFRFVRARKVDGGYWLDYGGPYTRKNIEALGKIMARVVDFIDRENATEHGKRPTTLRAA